MKSIDAIVKRWDLQPATSASFSKFTKWRDSLLAHLAEIEAKRGASHPIDRRVHNMRAFVEAETTTAIVRKNGKRIILNAGEFHWLLLVRLEQRQESMKLMIDASDPFTKMIDPGLRSRIKAGGKAVDWPAGYWKRVKKLYRAAF